MKRDPLTAGTKDYPILIAVVANTFSVLVAFPLNYNPFRQAFFSQILGRDTFSQKENAVFTAVVLTLTCFVSIVFPNIKQVISILGGLIAI